MDARLDHLARRLIEGLHLEDVSPADINPDAPLFAGGLGLDSIDALELAVIVERQYGVKISDMELGRSAFASLRALDAYIETNRKA
jgi:acyl carrier protein